MTDKGRDPGAIAKDEKPVPGAIAKAERDEDQRMEEDLNVASSERAD